MTLRGDRAGAYTIMLPREADPSSSGKPQTTDRIGYLVLPDGSIVHYANDGCERRQGSILQRGENLHVILDDRIWSKHGGLMQSSVDSTQYKKVGQMEDLHFFPGDWFHKRMLRLRR